MENYSDLIESTVNDQSLLLLAIGCLAFSALLLIIYLISYIKIFKKAGKPGWAIFVPIYNYIVMLQIAKMSLINIILSLIPIVNIFVMFKLNINIAKRFGKGTGFGIGLTLFSIIFIPLLAFSDSVIVDSIEDTPSSNTINNGLENSQIQNDIPVQNNMGMLNIETEPNIINNGTNMTTPMENNINNVSAEPAMPNIVPEPNAFNSQGMTTSMENNINNASAEPAMPNIVEEPNAFNNQVNMTTPMENNMNTASEEPVVPNIVEEPNAFNSQVNMTTPMENNINNASAEPVVPNIVEEPNAFNNQVNMTTPMENNMNNASEEPVMPNIMPEPNAFNSQVNMTTPMENNMNNASEEPAMPNIMPEPNAFNSQGVTTPMENNINNASEEPVISDIKTESNDNSILNNTQHSELLETSDKKICSKCGLEIPSIVTVCPKCGTEND